MTSPNEHPLTPEEELARFDRRRWATAARANVELEGFFASEEFEQWMARYVDGEISLEDILRWLDEQHPDVPAAEVETNEPRPVSEPNPTTALSRVEAALRGLQPVSLGDLDEAEIDALMDGLAKGPLTPQGQAFYDKMAADGLGVGMAEDGTLVYGANESV